MLKQMHLRQTANLRMFNMTFYIYLICVSCCVSVPINSVWWPLVVHLYTLKYILKQAHIYVHTGAQKADKANLFFSVLNWHSQRFYSIYVTLKQNKNTYILYSLWSYARNRIIFRCCSFHARQNHDHLILFLWLFKCLDQKKNRERTFFLSMNLQ